MSKIQPVRVPASLHIGNRLSTSLEDDTITRLQACLEADTITAVRVSPDAATIAPLPATPQGGLVARITSLADAAGRHIPSGRKLLTTAGAFVLAIVMALIGTGTSYALWNGRATVSAGTVTSGSTSLTVNGVQNYPIPGMGTIKLGPGQSSLALITVANTGTTSIAATVTGTTVTAQTAALAGDLTIILTPSATCTAGLTGGLSARMASFNTVATPFVMASGTSLTLCLEVMMDLDAPASVQNGTANFTMNLNGTQVRP